MDRQLENEIQVVLKFTSPYTAHEMTVNLRLIPETFELLLIH